LDETRRAEDNRLTQALARLVPKTAPDEDGRREVNRGFGDALASAFELAFTPALFGLLGWRLDIWLGTEPLFLLAFVVIVFVYEVWKLYSQYARDLDRQQTELLGRRRQEGESA
jgi:F0F1-type ATP synthase assembly protein I